MSASEVLVRIRRSVELVEEVSLPEAAAWMFEPALPWRRFRWHRKQQHFSGSYWAETMGAPVGYESRLEYANMLLADFDPEISWLLSQPFFMQGPDGGRMRRRIPDYLMVRRDGSVCVVDVKPAERLEVPRVRDGLAWSRRVIEEHGWDYSVQSEPNPVLLANVQFLAGYRRPFQFSATDAADAAAMLRWPRSFGEAVRELESVAGGAGRARALVLRLLWTRLMTADLTRPLSVGTVLNPRDAVEMNREETLV